MPATAINARGSSSDSTRSSPNTGIIRPNTRRNGPSSLPEELQEIKDSLEGRKYLEKHSLLCPAGEPATHTSLATCLHQISQMAGLQRPATNAIRSVAFLLDEMEDLQVNETIKEALDSQMTEFTSDMKILIDDTKEKIEEHIKNAGERLANITPPIPTSVRLAMETGPAYSYALALINPPAYANPRVAAREGIKARQFLITGIKNSKFSHLDTLQLKAELNKILIDLGLTSGKIRAITSSHNGGTVIEADNDEAANWFSAEDNQRKLCENIGIDAEFRTRQYNIIAFNTSLALEPGNAEHRQEICEANNLEPGTIISAKWAKAVDKRTPTQRTAHLLLTFNNAGAANRAITNGLSICSKRCHVERTKREPIRCLKCQGWNHLAKECTEERDKCANCAGSHRTFSCLVEDRRCVSCNTEDHASWSRKCPTFLRKIDEYNIRNPDNLLQFFPTTDPWTWSVNDGSVPSPWIPKSRLPQPSQVQKPSKRQLEKRPQQPRRPMDTYIPSQPSRKQTDTYIPHYFKSTTSGTRNDTLGQGEELGPTSQGPSGSSSQLNNLSPTNSSPTDRANQSSAPTTQPKNV